MLTPFRREDFADICRDNGYQDPNELVWLLEQIFGVSSILEVGSAEGHTLRTFARAAWPGAKLRSIDNNRQPNFVALEADMRRLGFDVEQRVGNSEHPETVAWALAQGPFDFVFIDADHGPNVVNDWRNYGPLARRFVGFHDISHFYVGELWTKQIKPNYDTEEMMLDPSRYGIGLVWVAGANGGRVDPDWSPADPHDNSENRQAKLMEQDPNEFKWLLEKIRGASSILEVGCSKGDSLKAMATVLKPGARIRAIDQGGPWSERPYPIKDYLRHAIKELKLMEGFDAEVMFADSHDEETLEWAKNHGPYDFVYIDGDCSYEGIKQDYEQYGQLAPLVGVHNIAFAAQNHGALRLWKEICATNGVMTSESVHSVGTGVVRRA